MATFFCETLWEFIWFCRFFCWWAVNTFVNYCTDVISSYKDSIEIIRLKLEPYHAQLHSLNINKNLQAATIAKAKLLKD